MAQTARPSAKPLPRPSKASGGGAKGSKASSKPPAAPVAPSAPPPPPGSLLALESVLGSLTKLVHELQYPTKALDPKFRAKLRAERLARLAAQLDQARAELASAIHMPKAPKALGATGTALAWDALLQRIAELSWLSSGASLPPGFLPLAAHLDHVHTVLRRHRYTGAELVTGPDGELIARLRPAS